MRESLAAETPHGERSSMEETEELQPTACTNFQMVVETISGLSVWPSLPTASLCATGSGNALLNSAIIPHSWNHM